MIFIFMCAVHVSIRQESASHASMQKLQHGNGIHTLHDGFNGRIENAETIEIIRIYIRVQKVFTVLSKNFHERAATHDPTSHQK